MCYTLDTIKKEVNTMKKAKKEINKAMFKMTDEELQLWLYNRKRGFVIENKKGKGSYKRKGKYGNAWA